MVVVVTKQKRSHFELLSVLFGSAEVLFHQSFLDLRLCIYSCYCVEEKLLKDCIPI